MSYIKAVDILPQELLEIIQNYIDGEYIHSEDYFIVERYGGIYDKRVDYQAKCSGC